MYNMKQTVLLFCVFISQFNIAQNKLDPTGNVGIGITNPNNSLEIRTSPSQSFSHLYFGEPSAISDQASAKLCFGGSGIQNASFSWVPSITTQGKLFLSFGGSDNGMNNSTKMTFQANGNIGIGTTAPKQKLTIVGDQITIDQGGPTNGQNSTAILRLQSSPNGAGEVLDFGMNIKSYGWIQPQDFNDPNAFYNLILNAKGGNVGIGTLNPDSKLAVNGTIHSKEVKVDMTGWSDFVFKKEYNLPTLEEVEKHIAEKGHLENIPSEKEVLENGINLGEMNAKLLQKIEELTLYMIQMKKENESVKKENIEIKEYLKELKLNIK
ncbi:hypothetical protein SAMN02927916_2324 [Flavobacterium anhuiense]|uniref:Uncharacterized protein n=2 Tax=Flavobacterium anhuiense TaxID=459526 RepID=A0ABY0LQD2_9FLAO|nr:hypothetical protein SAMN02927916_2324 [Flavobacterium anhuiense]